MTRITAFGRKRTHHEATVNTLFESEEKGTLRPEDSEPKKKKRKIEEPSNVGEDEAKVKTPQKGWGRSEEIKGE